MSFLGFRQARRKAKKIVSSRSSRPEPPPSPGSFASTSVVEIGDPSRPYVDAQYEPLTLQMDAGFAPDSFSSLMLESDSVSRPKQTKCRQSRRRSTSRRRASSVKSPHVDGAGSVQSKDGRLTGSHATEDVTRTTGCRRTPKLPPAPIKIPAHVYAPKLQFSRSADVSAELRAASTNLRESPVYDDSASAVSGITLPGALLANVYTVQADQPHGYVSRRITRIDSAILPVGDFSVLKSPTRQYSGITICDGVSLLPPLPPLTGVNGAATSRPTSGQGKTPSASDDSVGETRKCKSPDQLLMGTLECVGSASKHSQFSPITSLSTPDRSDMGTPDLIKDSSTSADGGSSDPQLNSPSSSDSTSPAWLIPSASLASTLGEERVMVLDFFPLPPTSGAPVEGVGSSSFPFRAGAPINEHNLNEAAPSRGPLVGQRQSVASSIVRRRAAHAQPRSSLRRHPASVGTHLLRPATLLPIGDPRISIRPLSGAAEGSQNVAPVDADNLSALLSSLPATRSEDIFRLPAFPESDNQFANSLSLASGPLSPDFLDHVVLADESTIRRRQRTTSHGSLSSIPNSGYGQTFPETPVASPLFSPGVGTSQAYPSLIPAVSIQRSGSVPKSLLGHGSQVSQRLIVGRSATTKPPMRMRVNKKSSRSKLRRQSARNSTSSTRSSLPTVAKGDAPTTSDRARLDDQHTRSSSAHSPDVTYSPKSALQRRSGSQRATLILPVPSVLPPSPPSQLPSPQKAASPSSPASPSPPSLPSPPPPSELHPPRRPVSQAQVSQYSFPPPPSSPPPATPPSNPLPFPTTCPSHSRANSLCNTNSSDRPPRPLGPRPPYRNAHSSPGSRDAQLPSPSRDSSIRATLMGTRGCVQGAPNACSGSTPGPKFQTPPTKFKGLTLEAAKWTFSSEELQAIVSQAIRQSGQASSIRLLPQEAAFVEVPEELEKLNLLMHELRIQYRLQVRKRDVLLRAIYENAEGPEFWSIALRSKLQELHETAVNLDRIADELFRLRDQAAQLSRMLAIHQGSALAMALRKLHSSFLKGKAEMQTMKDQIYMLEAERNEAWAQAQQVARDLDDLNDLLQNQSFDPSPTGTRAPSRRSSRVIASHKSYQDASRDGLRLSLSQQAFVAMSQNGSARFGSRPPSGFCTPCEPVPPVPPIPYMDLAMTPDLLSQNSAYSTSDMSSTMSARRALTRAEADLYGYLGLDLPELASPRPRPSSMAATSPSTLSPDARDMAFKRLSDIMDYRITMGGRRSVRIQDFFENEADALLNTFYHLGP